MLVKTYDISLSTRDRPKTTNLSVRKNCSSLPHVYLFLFITGPNGTTSASLVQASNSSDRPEDGNNNYI